MLGITATIGTLVVVALYLGVWWLDMRDSGGDPYDNPDNWGDQ